MNIFLKLTFILLLAFFKGSDQNVQLVKPIQNGFAVVELFTSQGCSSCPPADMLLGEILKRSQENNLPVYSLSFHVDYWNKLGWIDPFSKKEFSKRQYKYAQIFRENSVYTPQIVFNGKTACVGSYRSQVFANINKELKNKTEDILNVKYKKLNNKDSVLIEYELNSFPENDVLNIAIVQKSSVKSIKAGENKNRILHNYNIVRSFTTIDIAGKKAGDLKLVIPARLNINELEIIAYSQNKLHMTINCATKANIF